MDTNIRAINSELTQLYKCGDDIYHRYGVFAGLSDPAVMVLYGLYEDPERTMTQNDLVSTWSYPKQTINYTVNSLVKYGWVELRQRPGAGNSKSVLLTDEGRRVCEQKILPLLQAEEQSLARMTADEREQLLVLTRKQLAYLEEELQRFMGETGDKAQ